MVRLTGKDSMVVQDIRVGDINPVKLIKALRLKFGPRFEVHVRTQPPQA